MGYSRIQVLSVSLFWAGAVENIRSGEFDPICLTDPGLSLEYVHPLLFYFILAYFKYSYCSSRVIHGFSFFVSQYTFTMQWLIISSWLCCFSNVELNLQLL
ncbi:hypothetical protein MKW98_015890 [Papaver atlanticum]|uniref:Uncharacterized protein n=1 Tax=Papaver atlanticum TaxID=357466 RepID=A0AAD4STX8_9MAGN|nr:hypothetical protein MKW98_015890 [Papaver atlanticum]